MKIIVSGQAVACDLESGAPIFTPAVLESLGGLRYDADLCANYLYDDELNDLSLSGGEIELTFAPATGALRVVTNYWCPTLLNANQLQALVEQTLAQWSDGIGEGCFDSLAEARGLSLDLAPFAFDGYEPPIAEQIDDGCEAPRFAHLAKAVWKGNTDLVEQAIAAKADLNAIYDGHTPLLLAIQRKNIPIALRLIEGGADVERSSPMGTTPLIACASLPITADAIVVATALISHGARLDPQDMSGNTAIDAARNNQKADLLALLKSHAAR